MPVVITGDIISSSKLPLSQRQQLLNHLVEGLFVHLSSIWQNKNLLRTEAIQGDSFQVYLSDNREALRLALLIKSFCLSQERVSTKYRFDCRLSIAIGSVSFLHPDSLAKSGGLVFEYSGRRLKDITRTGSQLVFESTEIAWTRAVNMGLSLTDELFSRYTQAQSESLLLKLSHPEQTQDWLAEQIGIGRSAYSQRLKQTGWASVENFLEYYRLTLNFSAI